MWTVLVVLPLLVLTRHSQFPVNPGWMFEMVKALEGKHEGEVEEISYIWAQISFIYSGGKFTSNSAATV